jgi:hypothetical protein
MRTITIRRGILLSLCLAATLSMAACTTGKPPSSAGSGTGHMVPPAASHTPTHAASPPAATPSATPGGVQNRVITSAEKSQLTAAYLAFRQLQLSDVAGEGPMPGSVYYAYDPVTNTYWALADFEPSSSASLNAQVGFQDGGGIAMYRMAGAGPWQVENPGFPPPCGELRFFPAAVLTAWSMPTMAPPGLTC